MKQKLQIHRLAIPTSRVLKIVDYFKGNKKAHLYLRKFFYHIWREDPHLKRALLQR